MSNIKSKEINRIFVVLISIILCVVCYLLYANAHYVNDDHYFLYPFFDYKYNGAELKLRDVLLWMYEQINLNFRFANHLTIILLLMPHWIADLLSVMMTIVMIVSIKRLLNIKNAISISMAVMVSMIVLILPWYDQIFNVTFRLNYVWASALVLLFLSYFLNIKEDVSRLKKICIILLALIASMMHEGASVPICLGIIVQLILQRTQLPLWKKVAYVVFVLGAVLLVATPGLNSRILSSLEWRSVKSYILYMCGYNLPSLIFICLSIFALFRGYYRKMVESNIPIYLVAAIIGCGIFMVSPVIRASWFPTLYSIIGVIKLVREVFDFRIVKCKITLISLVYIIVLGHLLVSCYYSRIIYKEWENIATKYEDGVKENFYTPITLEKDIPMIAMGKAYGFRHQCWGNNIMSQMAGFYNVDRTILAIPEDLKKIENNKLVKVNGDNPF